jgi:hypothetical protein
VAALDRARDADQLWDAAERMYREASWSFDPKAVSTCSLGSLRDELAHFGVSRRHGPDTLAWRLIGEALTRLDSPQAVRMAVEDGRGSAGTLNAALNELTRRGQPWFPYLSGPKVSAMWIRMLAVPGNARIENIADIPVAVDVQVRRVTENLRVTNTQGKSLDEARPVIQATWRRGAIAAVGPPSLKSTCSAIDPAIWFFGKWGCSFCEKLGKAMPISPACVGCRLKTVTN